jgi:hypothetical protein
MKTFTKTPDGQLQVEETQTIEKTHTFTKEYLTSQREAILAQKERDNEARDRELAEVDAYLAECERLEIVETSIEDEKADVIMEGIKGKK